MARSCGTFGMMCWRSSARLSFAVAMLLLGFLNCGCFYQRTDQPGVWTGRIEAIPVCGRRVSHEAAALRIEAGPDYVPPEVRGSVPGVRTNMPRSFSTDVPYIPETMGAGRLPLLVEGEPKVVVDIEKLPMGQRVQIRGYMGVGLVYNRERYGVAGNSVARCVAVELDADARATVSEATVEHYIYISRLRILR